MFKLPSYKNAEMLLSIPALDSFFCSCQSPTAQHPSPLKDPILSSRTPKQLLCPPFL